MTTIDDRPVNTETTTAELLLAWDRCRARSRQTEVGMSEIGGCQRRVGYRLAGTEPTNASGSVQAVMGTAIHSAVEQVYREMQAAGLFPADDLIEHEVRFAGILGHLDRYDSVRGRAHDTKSTTQRRLDYIKLHGPDRQHLWQIHLYGAALIQAGRRVREVVIDYIARDTGNDHQVVQRFDPQHVRDALAWLVNVRELPVEMLNREYAPDSAFCGNCPFRDVCWDGAATGRDPRSVLFSDDPDAARWAQQLREAREAKALAEKLEAEAKGALDALRPNESGTSDVVDVGLGDVGLKWTVSTTNRIDTDAVRKEYEQAGAKPPMKQSQTTKLTLVPLPAEHDEDGQ